MAKSEVKVSDVIQAPIEKVWRLAADFGGIDKIMDTVKSCETEGEDRREGTAVGSRLCS